MQIYPDNLPKQNISLQYSNFTKTMIKSNWFLSDQYWIADMKHVLNAHEQFISKQKIDDEINFYGFKIKTSSAVYHPYIGSSTHFIGEVLFRLLKPNSSMLEIGCGSGALSCVATSFGAVDIIASDISEQSCSCTENNINMHGLQSKVKVIQSNLFENIPDRKFDLIVFNPPLLDTIPTHYPNEYNELSIDNGGQLLQKFSQNIINYLNPNGVLLLLVSNIGNRESISRVTENLSSFGKVSVEAASYKQDGQQWRFVISLKI